MVEIYMKECAYSYDVQALTRNFYPHQLIFLKSPDSFGKIQEDTENIQDVERIKIECKDTEIGISLFENEIPIFEKYLDVYPEETYKNQLKIALYQVLSKRTGRTLDWGTLTGVRPAKIIMTQMEEKEATLSSITKQMQKHYLCSEKKAELGYQVAVKEKKLLSEIDYKNGYSIYIGIPFCPTTCSYCSFTSFSAVKYKNYMDTYLDALFKEIEYAKDCIKNRKLTTIYVGGGTPTALGEKQLERLLKKIVESFDFTQVKEFTVEAGRPDSVNREKLLLLKKYGVGRISINPQTMKDETLVRIGRSHTVAQVKEAFALARETGHDNINMDLIAGLPGETLKDIEETLKEIQKLNPDSITVHSLVTKRAARLNQQGKQEVPQNVDEMTEMARLFAQNQGYEPYYMYRQKNAQGSTTGANQENIGYAYPGKECIYNVLIMEEKHTILALGAGGASKFVFQEENRMERIENVKSLVDYIERTDEMIERKAAFLRKEGLNEREI
ncbi:MAG: coproporphyrinogen dehydrogenase HemZ [Acetivibrio sp.]